jgi:hypothetical protein
VDQDQLNPYVANDGYVVRIPNHATGAGSSGTSAHFGNANALDLGNYDFSYIVPAPASGKYQTFTATLTNAATDITGTAFALTQSRTMHSGISSLKLGRGLLRTFE